MHKIRHIHFVGIGGSGMSGIAEVLLNEGYAVSGSDLSANEVTARLATLGAKIFLGHDASHVQSADVIVTSSAVRPNNTEVETARHLRIPIVRRAEMLAELMRFRKGIAIAGTHGKTTTTSLTTSLLAEAGLDPTFIIGGRLNSAGANAKLGAGEYLVAEADESDASFLYLNPLMAVVTNIDRDHMDTYGGYFSKLKQAFLDFLHQLPFYGLAVMCVDDLPIQDILSDVARPILTYGFSDQADLQITNYRQQETTSYFDLLHKKINRTIPIQLNLPGRHNALNAAAAIGIAKELEIENEVIQRALLKFAGVGRRFQQLGTYRFKSGEASLIDDYGHHPREIAATIQSARASWPHRQLVMIFQPHRYTRTRDLFEDFSEVLSQVDGLIMLDIYTAGEEPIPGADARALCRSIRLRGKVDPIFVPEAKTLPMVLEEVLKDGDVLIAQGAGNVSAIAANLMKRGLKIED